MLTVDFIDDNQQIEQKHLPEIERLLIFAADQEGIDEEAEVAVSFVDEDEIQAINKAYRNKDAVTDVISFALEEGEDDFEMPDAPRVLGDIIICVKRAKEQAEEYGHSFERELGFLSLHGLLHLLGYDHMNEADEARMFGRQDEILNAFGLRRDV
ncbi:rRNA maturation RNase YbeY [Macrococcoides canis]|uniref:Endoribonuclease YbeY n=1 Tax=Macrococcoides canis TaxID=1855823 RepID=A0A4R6C7J4_9STAP|nr:rRNA maturation RNase YbeY [Macrococcus canis]MEE1106709.1 rRNA maturation RNase YbeY [Macrococcus canis]TDM18420.1 rRNA maturation RNase YbeY [Macrococcus canis]TDM21533.1 rRNA maturation RNase YbeY [Macrococcus canis]TDM23592.1 rRNA maturation RNase YbeY [Macrococcus canis]TDM31672.1 rRNA maturation RNase YbeY [Macrococcus canis]